MDDAPWPSARLADDEVGGVHDTLLFVVRELDELIRAWPPTLDEGRGCLRLAHEATKHLSPVEVFATMMAGPPNIVDESSARAAVTEVTAQ